MSTVYGTPDDELRPIAHSRLILSGNHAFNNFAVPGLPLPVADVRSIMVYAASGGNPVTVTAKFDVIDPSGGVATQRVTVVAVSDAASNPVYVRVGGHVLHSLTIDDGGAGSSGVWAVTASNLDPLPSKATPPAPPFFSTYALLNANAKALAATPATTLQLPCDSIDPGSDLATFTVSIAQSRISTTVDGVYLAMAGIFWNPAPGGIPNFSRVFMNGFNVAADIQPTEGPDSAAHFVATFGLQSTFGFKWQKAGALGAQLQYGYDGSNSPNIFGAQLLVARIAPT